MLSRFWPDRLLGGEDIPEAKEGIASHWFPMDRVICLAKESRLEDELLVLRRCTLPVSEGDWVWFDHCYPGSQKRHVLRLMKAVESHSIPQISSVELLSIPGPDDDRTHQGDGLEGYIKALELPIDTATSCSFATFSDDAGVLAVVGRGAGCTVYLFDF